MLAQGQGHLDSMTSSYTDLQGWQIWLQNWVRLAPNGTNVGLFKISFSTFWLTEPKCTETDLKKSQICPIWDQSDLIWMPNLTSQGVGVLVAEINRRKIIV